MTEKRVDKRPCCAVCAHWVNRPYEYNICSREMLACDEGGGFPFRTHAHFLCVLYEPVYETSPAAPELFKLEADDGMNERCSRELAESYRREISRPAEA